MICLFSTFERNVKTNEEYTTSSFGISAGTHGSMVYISVLASALPA